MAPRPTARASRCLGAVWPGWRPSSTAIRYSLGDSGTTTLALRAGVSRAAHPLAAQAMAGQRALQFSAWFKIVLDQKDVHVRPGPGCVRRAA